MISKNRTFKKNNLVLVMFNKLQLPTFFKVVFLAAFIFSQQSVVLADTTSSTIKKFQWQKNMQASWSAFTRNLRYREGAAGEDQLIQLGASANAYIPFTHWIQLDTDITATLNSARIASRFRDNSANALTLNKLEFKLHHPRSPLAVKFGAIDQTFLQSEQLITAQAFPGVMIELSKSFDHLSLAINAQQAIPTSVSLDSDRIENEDEARLQTIGGSFRWDYKNYFSILGSANYFAFDDLPSVIAFESSRLGNDIVGGETPANAQFANQFKGWTQFLKLEGTINKSFKLFTQLNIQENQETTSRENRSQWLSLGANFTIGSLNLTPQIANFYQERNSGPAYYNSGALGHNNREGMQYSLRTQFTNYGFFIDAAYTQANLLKRLSNGQEDLRAYSLILGVESVSF